MSGAATTHASLSLIQERPEDTLQAAQGLLPLESRWAIPPAAPLTILLIIRTYLEDKTLREELAGYRAYAEDGRYRLLPGVW